MSPDKQMLRERIDADRERLIEFLQRFVQARSPNPPSWCDPEHPMLGILQDNVEQLRGFRPDPIVAVGGTDTRLWRYIDVPAFVYGPYPTGMGSADEHVPIEDFLHIVRTHVLSAYDYLSP
ncbi:MAG: hypothetical protein JRH16_19110 [Deltaproteobacteria bacterium]|nr:hypothetical protein [Deltaproteobacteria bacterium]MBW2398903.1 hypothetical protein [Deltaproteobacteria bacterium]